MLTRVLVALALLPILVFVLYLSPAWVLPVGVAVVSACSVLEFLLSGLVAKRRLAIYAAVAAALIPLWCYFDPRALYGVAGLFALALLLFCEAVTDHSRVTFAQVSAVLFAAAIIPLFLSSLIRIAAMEWGRWLILLPFLAAFGSDITALFVGRAWGRHPLAPDISPKKTVEGAGGGLLGAVLFAVAYILVVSACFSVSLPFVPVLVAVLVGAVVSQLGDLSFSLVKRECGVKDYGRALPGHGGILDRFDSLLFAAPAVELCLAVFFSMGGGA
ncbi:MAG: phosphatidate cytidylyltransferase [Oscillospiraceae bacterium]|nr:phosphatidate cytidylyltransferase [Oscillospiraceae bacterium]